MKKTSCGGGGVSDAVGGVRDARGIGGDGGDCICVAGGGGGVSDAGDADGVAAGIAVD